MEGKFSQCSLASIAKSWDRKMMQQVGFLLDFILFVVPCFHYAYYTKPANIRAFQAMYFLSSFFNQFGPNSVTFLVAAEVYPTPIRATAHGFSAAVGKLGALTAAILYNYITTQQIFYVVPWWGLLGALLTYLFLPDTTGLDLKEQERRWNYIREGREHEYHGIAIHPQHLSLWERFRGVGKNYDQELDFQQKVKEMRMDWEEWQAAKAAEEAKEAGIGHLEHLDHFDLFDEHEHAESVHSYFERTSSKPSVTNLSEKPINKKELDGESP
jgi:Sugar (and other) transporter